MRENDSCRMKCGSQLINVSEVNDLEIGNVLLRNDWMRRVRGGAITG